RAGNDALLARRQRHVGAVCREHVIEREYDLAVPADGEAFDGADPQLLNRIHFGRSLGPRQAAVELVDEPEVAQDVPEITDLSLVEMRQVDAGAEEPLPGVARVAHLAAAQHADLALRIQ